MSLTLSVLRCPESVAPQTRRLAGGECSIGRGAENDWVLPDPDRHLSKQHCVLAWRAGGWQVADTSSNGTFLNRDSHPLGRGQARPLADGDRLRLGAYEIEVRIEAEAHAAPAPGGWDSAPARGFQDNPFRDDPLAPPAAGLPDDFLAGAFGTGSGLGHPAGGAALPADFDPLSPADPPPFAGPTVADHMPATQDAFTPPRTASQLPDDWDLDFSPAAAPPSPPPPSPVMPPPRAEAPPAPDTEDPFAEPLVDTPPPPAQAPTLVPPPPAAAPPDAAMAAFLRGAGLAGPSPADPLASLEALGAAFRAAVAGLRYALIARAEIKGEFRIEQTMIRRQGNNPLKFSADDDDALAALLGLGRRMDMTPAAAIADALRDMRLHELATMGAMQAAVRALLAKLDPDPLRQAADKSGGLTVVPAQRKARAWDAYEALHRQVSQALADDFDSVFGRAFARAYEDGLQAAAGKEPR